MNQTNEINETNEIRETRRCSLWERRLNMLAKKLRTTIGQDKKIVLHVPDMAQGEVEVIILQKEKRTFPEDENMAGIPRHRVGSISGTLRREEIYGSAR
jgi:hypothetical protein